MAPEPIKLTHTNSDKTLGHQTAEVGRTEFNADTVGGGITCALRKELLYLWATNDPASLNLGLLDTIVNIIATSLIDRLIGTANKRFPECDVEAKTNLLEIPLRPNVYNLPRNAVEQAELLEELHGFLSSNDVLGGDSSVRALLKRDVSARLPMSHSWQRWLCGGCAFMLPPNTVMSFCATVVPMLLAQHWFSSPVSWGDESDPDNPFYDKESLPAGAPQGLAKAMRCRKRIVALESELIAREKAEHERQAFEKAEGEKIRTRLMEVNHQLEDKLRARTEELKRAGQKIIESQCSVDDVRDQLTGNKREITQLKYKLEQDMNLKKDTEVREQEHTRALMRSAARESTMIKWSKERSEQLQRCIDGQAAAEVLQEPTPDTDQVNHVVDQIEADLQARMERRKEYQEAALRDFEDRIERKRQEYREVSKKLREVNTTYRYSVTLCDGDALEPGGIRRSAAAAAAGRRRMGR